MSDYCPITTEASALGFVHCVAGVVESRLHLIRAEKCARVENSYDCGGYEGGDGQRMSSLVGRYCDDEDHSLN